MFVYVSEKRGFGLQTIKLFIDCYDVTSILSLSGSVRATSFLEGERLVELVLTNVIWHRPVNMLWVDGQDNPVLLPYMGPLAHTLQ